MTKLELQIIKMCVDTLLDLLDIEINISTVSIPMYEAKTAQKILERELQIKRFEEEWPKMD